MKKNLFFGLAVAGLFLTSASLLSCQSNDDDTAILESPSSGSLEDEYFTIEGAVYKGDQFPSSTSDGEIGTVTVNSQALSGGMNFITVRTTTQYKVFYVGIEGVRGYYIYTPTNYTKDGSYYIYQIPIYYSVNYNKDITMIISGETTDGKVPKKYPTPIKWVESQSGDLNINLTFSQAKDIDLHLIMPNPNGEGTIEIYYGNKGYSYTKEDGTSGRWGLDHDSNAGCSIDNLNNENIFIPAAFVKPGTYTVKVNMYQNCNSNLGPTTWSVAARYKGAFVSNQLTTYRTNPATGSYAANAARGDKTEVIKFTITQDQISRGLSPIVLESFRPLPLDDMAQMKLEEAEWE
jgi:hypothetical protein